MALRHSRVVTRGQRRETSWVGLGPTVTTVTGEGGTIIASANAALLAKRPFTIIRLHLALFARSDQEAATEQFGGAVGVAVVSDQAVAIGVTAVPTPVTDDSSDLWMLHRWYMGLQGSTTTNAPASFIIDSKAMRKVNDDQDIIVVHELSSTIGEGQVFTMAGRMLIKEH